MTKYNSKNSHAGVYGKTIIDHRLRIKMGISCNDYVVMDFIMSLFQEKKKGFSTDAHQEQLNKAIGCYPEDIYPILKKMVDKQFLTVSKCGYLTTNKWDQHFNRKLEEEFESLWKKYGNKGTKARAKKYYITLSKEGITYEHIDGRIDIYLKFLEITKRFQMHFSSFLSPGDKPFDNEEYQEIVEQQGSFEEEDETVKFSI